MSKTWTFGVRLSLRSHSEIDLRDWQMAVGTFCLLLLHIVLSLMSQRPSKIFENKIRHQDVIVQWLKAIFKW